MIDLFRGHLEAAQGDLANSKNRVAELEQLQSQDKLTIKSYAADLATTGMIMIPVTVSLR